MQNNCVASPYDYTAQFTAPHYQTTSTSVNTAALYNSGEIENILFAAGSVTAKSLANSTALSNTS
jgi:hypothetical protein